MKTVTTKNLSSQCDKQPIPPVKCKTTLSNPMTLTFPLQSLTLIARVNYSRANQKWYKEVENFHNILYNTNLGLTKELIFRFMYRKS